MKHLNDKVSTRDGGTSSVCALLMPRLDQIKIADNQIYY